MNEDPLKQINVQPSELEINTYPDKEEKVFDDGEKKEEDKIDNNTDKELEKERNFSLSLGQEEGEDDHQTDDQILKLEKKAEAEDKKKKEKAEKMQEKIKERIIKYLLREHILEIKKGFNVIDLNKLTDGSFWGRGPYFYLGLIKGKRIKLTAKIFFEKMSNFKVVSKEDFDSAQREGKEVKEIPLFNIPESKEEAFDIETIRQKKYYLNFGDLGRNTYKWDDKIKTKDGEKIEAREYVFFTKLFKDFKAKRDKNGNLLVLDKETGDFVKPNFDFYYRKIGTFSSPTNSMTRFLVEYCPNLLEKGIIKLSDFKIIDDGYSGNLIRKEKILLKGSTEVVLKGVKYYIGRKDFIFRGDDNKIKDRIPKENLKIVLLDNDTAGIVEINKGREILKYTFDLLDSEEKKEKRTEIQNLYGGVLENNEITARTLVNGKEMRRRIKPYRVTEDNFQRQNETPESYVERVSKIGDYNFIKKITQDFSRESGLGIHNLDWKEQQWLCTAAYELREEDYKRLLEFGKKFGISGLKTFLSCELDLKMADKILDIEKNYSQDSEELNILFSKYAQIVDGTEETIQEVDKIYQEVFFEKEVDKGRLREIILVKAKDLLLTVSEKLKEVEEKEEKENLVRETIQELEYQEEVNQKNLKEIKDVFYEFKNQDFDSEKISLYQQNLESKLENLIYGQESAELPHGFKERISQDILNYQPELDSDKETYLPVGVSSELPREGEMHKKPIDALAYMFWLQNQQKKSGFMVVDSIQENNYKSLYGLSEEECLEKALENGRRDKEWYQKIKEVFNLDNIEFQDYSELRTDPEMIKKRELIDRVEQNSPLISQALEKLVERGVEDKAEERRELLKEYGKEEITFILAKGEMKIGHQKEYRYDILSRIIPIYDPLKQHQEDVLRQYELSLQKQGMKESKIKDTMAKVRKNIDKFLVDLSLYLAYYQNYPKSYKKAVIKLLELNNNLKEIKDKIPTLKKNISNSQRDIERARRKAVVPEKQIEFIQNKIEGQEKKLKDNRELIENYQVDQKELEEILRREKEIKEERKNIFFLNNIEKQAKNCLQITTDKHRNIISQFSELGEKIKEEEWFQNLDLPEFYYPQNITGMSFEMKNNEGQEFAGFREFYSTIKSKDKRLASIEANQVIASTDKIASAKLLVLSHENQVKYFNKILRPLLINYYIATSKDKKQAEQRFREDIKDCQTISDIIKLIQEKIISPIEKRLENKKEDYDLEEFVS